MNPRDSAARLRRQHPLAASCFTSVQPNLRTSTLLSFGILPEASHLFFERYDTRTAEAFGLAAALVSTGQCPNSSRFYSFFFLEERHARLQGAQVCRRCDDRCVGTRLCRSPAAPGGFPV